MSTIPSLVRLIETKHRLQAEHLNVLATYESPKPSYKKLWFSYLIDFSLTLFTVQQMMNSFQVFLSKMVYPQLIWQGQEYFNRDSYLIQLAITPILFWTIQFLGVFIAGQTPGMKLMKISIKPKNSENLKINFKDAAFFSFMNLASSWCLGIILTLKFKNNFLMEEITNLRLLDQNEFDWAQEISSLHPTPSFEEFPYKLADQLENTDIVIFDKVA